MTDEIEKNLRALTDGAGPSGRANLSEEEKDALIEAIGGPLTTSNIRKALKDYPKARIPFLFSSLDPQLVADVMENDMTAAIARSLKVSRGSAQAKKGAPKKGTP